MAKSLVARCELIAPNTKIKIESDATDREINDRRRATMQLIATAINIATQTVLLARVTHKYTATPNTMSQSMRRTSYDVVMAGKSRRVVPDGIVAHRNAVRQRGGIIAVALALGVLVVGLVLLALPGSLTGLLGFVLTFIALPTMPLFGVPAAGGFSLYALSFVSSV